MRSTDWLKGVAVFLCVLVGIVLVCKRMRTERYARQFVITNETSLPLVIDREGDGIVISKITILDTNVPDINIPDSNVPGSNTSVDEQAVVVEEYTLPFVVSLVQDAVVKIEVKGEYEYNSWSGSGVFVSDNLILTAGHIVDGVELHEDPETIYKMGQPITVEFNNRVKVEVDVVDIYVETLELTDVGLLRIEILDSNIPDSNVPWPKIVFGTAAVGETVFAIGEPFGLFPSVTSGIVSALNVDLEDDYYGELNVFQTDCPLNPGNSGCPVFNLKGEVVAICVGGKRGSDGIGFCIPADVCKLVIAKYEAIKALENKEVTCGQ